MSAYIDTPDSYYKSQIKDIPLLSDQEIIELCTRRDEGDITARNKIVHHNLRFAYWVALRYQGFLPFEDIVQEANIGLMYAADRYNPSLGCRFSSYAMYCVKGHILRAISVSYREIRTPSYLNDKICQVLKAEESMYKDEGFFTREDAAANAYISKRNFKLVEKARSYRTIPLDELSPYDLELLSDESELQSAEDIALENYTMEMVRWLVSNIQPANIRSRLSRYFGLEAGYEDGRSLSEIAAEDGVTKHAVEYSVNNAKYKFRKSLFNRKIKLGQALIEAGDYRWNF